MEAFGGESMECVAIESVAGGDEEARMKRLVAQDREAGANPLLLLRQIDSCEFGFVVNPDEGGSAAGALVTIAVQGDSGAFRLQRPHAVPEFRVR